MGVARRNFERDRATFGYGASPRGMRVLRDAMEEMVRRQDGLEEFRLPAGVVEACCRDGRHYSAFVGDLIRRGLADWKAERGE